MSMDSREGDQETPLGASFPLRIGASSSLWRESVFNGGYFPCKQLAACFLALERSKCLYENVSSLLLSYQLFEFVVAQRHAFHTVGDEPMLGCSRSKA